MDDELKQIVTDMTARLADWLDKPSPARQRVDAIREELANLKGELGASVVAETLKSLEKADTQATRFRQREAAEAIASLCRPLGVMLEAKQPPKRQRRQPAAKPTGDTSATEDDAG